MGVATTLPEFSEWTLHILFPIYFPSEREKILEFYQGYRAFPD